MNIVLLSLFFLAILGVCMGAIFAGMNRRLSRARRFMEVVQDGESSHSPDSLDRTGKSLLSLARIFRSVVGAADDEKLQPKFVRAGLKRKSQADVFFASRMVASIGGLICGSLLGTNAFFWSFALGFLGFMAPDFWLGNRIKSRKGRIQRSIPDAIDLMVICVDAGLGLDQALMRVGQELAISHPDLHEEFLQINLEQRAGKPRLEAWQSMADRTAIPEFAALVNMLIQTDRFGTPVVRALSRFSQEMREKRRQRAEEAAAKTKIKILFPLVLFIFPCVFIVLLGPALLNLARSFETLK